MTHPVTHDADDRTGCGTPAHEPPSTEREEALWCGLMRSEQRLRQVERDNLLLHELVALLKDKVREHEEALGPPRARRRLTPAEQADLARCLTAGASIEELMRRFHITKSSAMVYRWKHHKRARTKEAL